jgi:SSS family solute:Na+ symporter/sodium/pantothenate symporter
LIPELKDTDEIIPRLALLTTKNVWGGWGNALFGGLILAAPFGAVMATVSSYLVVIASGLVRDLYQRFLRPHATQREIRLLSYSAMIVVGGIAVAANISPVTYLQSIVVFSGTGAAATFVMPALMTAYWRRATAAGTIAAMLAGAGACFSLYLTGFILTSSFTEYRLLGLHPLLWGLATSLIAGIAVSLVTQPPAQALLARLFDALPEDNSPQATSEA